MKATDIFKILFRKYPVFRVFSVILVIFIVLTAISGITLQARKIPEIYTVNPPVGAPGDMMIITGENFGDIRNPSDYVEVGGSKITASGYLGWEDTQIKLILPPNVQDGLVIVSTKTGKSKPSFFANAAGIPVEVLPDTKTSLPVITQLSAEKAAPGSLLIISGTNFGTIRSNAQVFFTAGWETNSEQTEEIPCIAASEDNYDYEYWSDSEIHIRVPDGAVSGQIYVQTEKGKSNLSYLEISLPAGTKEYKDKKTYLIQLNADIEDINSRSNTTLSLRIPRPPVMARQPAAYIAECRPEPVFESYQNTIIHQFELSKAGSKKLRFNHSFVVDEYALTTSINPKYVKPFTDKSRVLYTTFTSPDSLIKSDDEEYVKLAASIVKNETNPYLEAKLVYEYLLNTFKLVSVRKPGSDPKDLLKDKSGDAYDFAVTFTALLRALKIPAIPVSGILVDVDLKAVSHWWSEFYLENFGWVPVDPAMGLKMEYKAFKTIEDPFQFYFGNIDSQHIVFSRGYNELKPTLSNSNIVYKERTFALQSIWEESSSGKVNYSSLWNDPVIAGIY